MVHHPAVGHRTAYRDAEHLAREDGGAPCRASDVRGSRSVHGGIHVVGSSRSEIGDGTTFGGPDDAGRLGCDERLVVKLRKDGGLHHLGIDHRGGDLYDRLPGEDDGPFVEGPYVPSEPVVPQELEEALIEHLQRAEVLDVIFLEVHVLDVLDDLLQSGEDGVSAVVGHLPEEHVEGRQVPLVGFEEVAVRHCQLIEVHDHRDVPSVAHAHLIASA